MNENEPDTTADETFDAAMIKPNWHRAQHDAKQSIEAANRAVEAAGRRATSGLFGPSPQEWLEQHTTVMPASMFTKPTPPAPGSELPERNSFGGWIREGVLWVYRVGLKGVDGADEIGEWGESKRFLIYQDLPRGGWRKALPAPDAGEVERLKQIIAGLLRCPEVREASGAQWLCLCNMDYGEDVDTTPLITAIEKALECVPEAWAEYNEGKRLHDELTALRAQVAELITLARAYLAEHDPEPITEEWLSVAHAHSTDHFFFDGGHTLTVYISGHAGIRWFLKGVDYSSSILLETRGQLRQLAAALGIELRGE